MKAIKILGVAMAVFALTGTVSAQKDVSTSTTTTTTLEKEYFTDTKTLVTFFVSGTIPADFPKYDSKLDKEVNKKAVAVWAKKPANNALLSEKGKAKLNTYDSNQMRKNTKR